MCRVSSSLALSSNPTCPRSIKPGKGWRKELSIVMECRGRWRQFWCFNKMEITPSQIFKGKGAETNIYKTKWKDMLLATCIIGKPHNSNNKNPKHNNWKIPKLYQISCKMSHLS